jgi:hypothetical protein
MTYNNVVTDINIIKFSKASIHLHEEHDGGCLQSPHGGICPGAHLEALLSGRHSGAQLPNRWLPHSLYIAVIKDQRSIVSSIVHNASVPNVQIICSMASAALLNGVRAIADYSTLDAGNDCCLFS